MPTYTPLQVTQGSKLDQSERYKRGDTNNVFEFVVTKEPFEPIPIAAMICTAAPQSHEAIAAIIPVVLASA